MADYPPITGRVAAKLARAEIAAVNAHSLHVAIARAMREGIDFAALTEVQIAVSLLSHNSAPENVLELGIYLTVPQTLQPQSLSTDFFCPRTSGGLRTLVGRLHLH